jgi:hypothetical protein
VSGAPIWRAARRQAAIKSNRGAIEGGLLFMSGKCDLPLHGLTVVIDTPGPLLYIGRYDSEDPERIILRDAEVRPVGPEESKESILARSARYGVFKTDDRIEVPRRNVAWVRLLSEIKTGG